jgi:hypothetical protein
MIRGFDSQNTRTLLSFFLCRLKLRYAFLQNSNSAFEVIYCTARRVKFLLAFGRIFRNQFLEKVYVALQATCSSHHAFFHRADFHTRNILCACGAGTERYADGKNQRLPDHNPVPERSWEAATAPDAARLGRLRPASAITRLVNWGDFSASVESQEHALAEIQKALPDHQLHGYLGCSAGTLSRGTLNRLGISLRRSGPLLALHVISRSTRWRGRNARSPSPRRQACTDLV